MTAPCSSSRSSASDRPGDTRQKRMFKQGHLVRKQHLRLRARLPSATVVRRIHRQRPDEQRTLTPACTLPGGDESARPGLRTAAGLSAVVLTA